MKKATKRELIVVATMISRMIGTSVFSDRTRFSVSTAVYKPTSITNFQNTILRPYERTSYIVPRGHFGKRTWNRI